MSFRIVWFALLVCTTCLEGLGRRYLPAIPSTYFYFSKDVVLVSGLLLLRPSKFVVSTATGLYRGFKEIWAFALVWTLLEMFNPGQQSTVLGLIGLRAYWLWWLAPVLIAHVLQDDKTKRQAILEMARECSSAGWVQASPLSCRWIDVRSTQRGGAHSIGTGTLGERSWRVPHRFGRRTVERIPVVGVRACR